jgi:Tfp pilus assembly ATPase PilU
MKAKEYNLITQCVETGVMLGWNRAHKHDATPEDEAIRNADSANELRLQIKLKSRRGEGDTQSTSELKL